MGGERANRGRRRWPRVAGVTLVVLLVVGLVVGGGVAYQDGRLNALICDGPCGPEAVVPPTGLADLTTVDSAVAAPVAGAVDVAAALDAAEGETSNRLLGSRVGVAVASLDPDSEVSTTTDDAFVPASTTKLLTGLAALLAIDPQTRFSTSVVRESGGDGLVLVGGGDPYLTDEPPRRPDVRRASLADLADRTATALAADGTTQVGLNFDDSLFSGPSDNPDWERSYLGQVVTPISALWVDRGVDDGVHSRSPARDATERFADLLEDRGIEVSGDPERVEAPDVEPLASVRSATVGQVVEAFVRTSDNEAAEAMARQVALARGEAGSFEAGATEVVDTLAEAGIEIGETRLRDGSGLSRDNRIAPTTLVEVVRLAYASGRTAPVVDDLPVSGFSGTLEDRFGRSTYGLVRAKTGTLSGVHSLAGVVIDRQGRPLVFAVMTDDADTADPFGAQAAVDDVVEAMAATG